MIRVISKKFSVNSSAEFVNYVYKLGETAKSQRGFMGSSSYWASNNKNIYVMSDWQSEQEWYYWKNSHERKEIYEEYKQFIADENFKMFNRYNRKQNIFLM